MTKHTHTHRGHCQLCGAIQALATDNSIVAKHGYTVDGGYFHGACPGSDSLNLHISRALADSEIVKARARAVQDIKQAARLSSREIDPAYVWNGDYKYVRPAKVVVTRGSIYYKTGDHCELQKEEVMVRYAAATVEFQDKGRAREIERLQNDAKMCRSYANNLEAMADKITGKVAPFLASDLKLRGFAVGDTVRIGGVKGFDAKIEAIADKPYSQSGWRHQHGTVMAPHAQVTRPAITEKRVSEKAGGYVIREARPAHTYWEPLRFLKKPK